MDFCPVPTLVQGLSTDFDAQSVTDEVIKDVANAIQQVFCRKKYPKKLKNNDIQKEKYSTIFSTKNKEISFSFKKNQ